MANAEIRTMLKANKIPYWKIALKLGVHENTILRKMRVELSESEKEYFINAISEIKSENKETV